MLSNQQLYLVNHFALLARRHGIALPDLRVLLQDENQLLAQVEAAQAQTVAPAVADAARKLAMAFSWPLSTPVAAVDPGATRAASPPLAPAPHVSDRKPPAPAGEAVPSATPMASDELARARAALRVAAGPIADFIVEQIDDADRLTLRQFIEQAATLAQLDSDRRRALRVACGLND